MKSRLAWIVMSFLTAATLAHAADAVGEWARDDGKTHVRFAPCGEFLCGTITWVRDPKGAGKVGQKVFFDLKPNGDNTWSGTAFNPDDGNNYSGELILKGSSLRTTGCALGGLICKHFDWTRIN
jgi:uncharacterized protein (DUF2147 family)